MSAKTASPATRIEILTVRIEQAFIYAPQECRSRADATTRIEAEPDVEFDLTPEMIEAITTNGTPDDD